MKKKIIAVILAVVMVSGIIACGNSGSDSEETRRPRSTEEVTEGITAPETDPPATAAPPVFETAPPVLEPEPSHFHPKVRALNKFAPECCLL